VNWVDYRGFAEEQGVDWVLEIGDRYGITPGVRFVTRPPRGLEDWHVLIERGRRGDPVGIRFFRLARTEEAFQ
jgi:hypothetical protein